MNRNIWDKFQDLKRSLNSGVEPMEDVKLQTKVVKVALGVHLVQSVIIALWWSINIKSASPWLIPVGAFLQVGWVWNKVTDSWKFARVRYTNNEVDNTNYSATYFPPTLNIKNDPITSFVPVALEEKNDPQFLADSKLTGTWKSCETDPDPGSIVSSV